MAETPGLFDQFTTVQPLFRGVPTWLEGQDQRRLSAYDTYEQIYWNVPDAFKLIQRGDDAMPIYIPSGRQIVDTLHRFMANDLAIVSDREYGSDIERNTADQWLVELFRRERFQSRWSGNKRYGIMRGDWMWHLYADPEREEGSRLSILPLDPAAYFPVFNDDNVDELIGCHIVEPYTDNEGKQRIRRLSYMKETERGGPSPIIVSDLILEIDAWGQPGTTMDTKVVTVLENDHRLPDPIDQLPVYHIKNFVEPQNPFGSSELRGMERLIAAINQSISDEELSLAMDGLGVYRTTSSPPMNDEGEEVGWRLGPARVVEHDEDSEFDRVQGIATVVPYQDHIKYLHEQLDQGSGTPSLAKGDVDVQVAESGVALALRMGPLLARAYEREWEVSGVTMNMLYDLRKFGMAYEGAEHRSALEAVRWMPTYGEKLPVNRKQRFNEVMRLVDAKVVSRKWARQELRKIGYDLPEADDEMLNEILEEQAALGQIEADVGGFRIDAEIDDGDDDASD